MEVYYQNHRNEIISFSGFPVAVQNPESIISNTWQYSYVQNTGARNRISAFYRDVSEKNATVSIFADSEDEYQSVMEELLQITEQDVLNNMTGRLYINGDYLECFLVARTYTEYEEGFGTVEVEITILSPHPFWIRQKNYLFIPGEGDITNNKCYPNRYAYRYANGLRNRYITNEYIAASNFKIVIFGYAFNPQIIIGEYSYQVNILLEEGERLEIDSISRTVQKIMNNGTIVNAFDARDKRNSVFKKIRPGRNLVSWSGRFGFSVCMYEERSEPRWQ